MAQGFTNQSLALPLPINQGGTGATSSDPVLQRVNFQTGTVATGSTLLPFDNTIPQIGEGNQYMSLAITPKSATSILEIEVVLNGTNSAAGSPTLTVALFRDSTANAIAAACQTVSTGGFMQNIKFIHTLTSGSTASTTFTVRAGGQVAGTTTFNGSGGAQSLGGVMSSSITIYEYTT